MAAGTCTVTSDTPINFGFRTTKMCRKVIVDWLGASSGGAVPTLDLDLKGFVVKVITDPGSTAPTDNYDIVLKDPDDASFDAMGGKLVDRDTANSEHVYPVVTGAVLPVFLCGTYTLAVTGNSVNSATGRIIFYLVDEI